MGKNTRNIHEEKVCVLNAIVIRRGIEWRIRLEPSRLLTNFFQVRDTLKVRDA